MRVQVIGAGSVGLLIASFLAEEKIQTTVICKTLNQAKKLQQKLIRTNIDSTTVEVKVNAQTSIDEYADLTIVAVKAGQVADLLPTLNKNTPTIFCQNGLSHYYIIEQYGFTNAIYGSAQFGATKDQPNHVYHKGVGIFKLATKRKNEFLCELMQIHNERFPLEFEENAEKMLFEKALLNCFVNPLTALMNMKNGELIKNKYTYEILRQLHKELSAVFDDCVSFENVIQLCEKTSENTSSMLADHLAKRKSEAPYIVGAVLQRADDKGKEIPTLMNLYQLLLAKEELGGYSG